MGIVKPALFVPLQGGAYAVWAMTALTYAVSLLLIAVFWSGWRTLKLEDTLRGEL